ncbi:hypothetical protein MUG78_16900 [Gordonia alkaliphila]|uniref:hypothetical protein n=1 Tax=Gordonia alkaliphila TaxID=1053547 RepID=UPI001FF5E83C|nr:hypothetical protein [Gordonia alkaliphila]MCK0441080.1 hypothetical protein [Gordonia alkaliphila]
MQPLETIIDPATAVDGKWAYIVALKDDDWDQWTTMSEVARYNGARREGRWNLRSLGGDPVGWDYADDEIIILEQVAGAGSGG